MSGPSWTRGYGSRAVLSWIALTLTGLLVTPAVGWAASRDSRAPAERGPQASTGSVVGGSLERQLARNLVTLDELLGLETFPNSSPLWPARFAASLDHRAQSLSREGERIASRMRELAEALRQLGAERGLAALASEDRVPVDGVRTDLLERALGLAVATRRALDGAGQATASVSGAEGEARSPAPLVVDPATISGVVTDAVTAAPLGGYVHRLRSNGDYVDTVVVAADGTYSVAGLAAGTYLLLAEVDGYRSEVYDDVPFEGLASLSSATPLTVAGGETLTGIDFVLSPVGRVAGTVREGGTDAAVAGARVLAYNPQGFFVHGATTAADGSYRIDALPTGSYFIKTDTDTHVNEVYDNRVCDPFCDPRTGDAVSTVDGSTTMGIDFELQRRGSIAGRVTHSASGTAVPGAGIYAINSTFDFVRTVSASDDGTYVLSDLPVDGYYVRTITSGYRDEVYDDVVCESGCSVQAGTLVTVQAATETSGVDFALDRLGVLAGRVTARDTGDGLGLEVRVISPNGNVVASGRSTGGEFRIGGLEPGSYYVKADTGANAPGYQDELFDGVPCEPSCDLLQGSPVSVALNLVTTAVDFTLIPCAHDTERSLAHFDLSSSVPASFEACERVRATDLTIHSAADVTFKAGRAIALGDGFRVETGASFRAVIEPAWIDP